MKNEFERTVKACTREIETLEPELKQEAAARLFLEYCLTGGQTPHMAHLAPLIHSVAAALTHEIKTEDDLSIGVRAVQLYLRTPPVEYFGETLVRLNFISNQEKEEMLNIKPDHIDSGSFLIEQGKITQDQRDMAVISQRRLFSVKEVFSKLLKDEGIEEDEQTLMENLKDIVHHFMVSTADLEKRMKSSQGEGYQHTLDRLNNIISETEQNSHNVLEFVDDLFDISDQLESVVRHIQSEKVSDKIIQELKRSIDHIKVLNTKLNASQGIQDRTGQQLQKVIPTVKGFHENLLEVAKKLQLNLEKIESDDDLLTKSGYGVKDDKRLNGQGDVDDLLANLGL